MGREDSSQQTRRAFLVGAGAFGAVGAALYGLGQFLDYRVVGTTIHGGGHLVEVSAHEDQPFLFPATGPLTLTCWIKNGTRHKHPNWHVASIDPDGSEVARRLVSNPTPAEVLREESLYYVEAAQQPGEHRLELRTADGGLMDSATIEVMRRD